MAYPASTLSWGWLASLRRRGQKPAGPLLITDSPQQRNNLEESGAFALTVPTHDEDFLVAGLDVVLIATYSRKLVMDGLRRLVNANPRTLTVYWRGRGVWAVR